jgi:hypothetical protein
MVVRNDEICLALCRAFEDAVVVGIGFHRPHSAARHDHRRDLCDDADELLYPFILPSEVRTGGRALFRE